ncbi:Acyl-CoA dehydrogenase [Micromonospora pallida]|uniref:Acyl-CoA dehydrogenase n=1 Tax=Micromonospora pallida TaxID=145854 RepID=A0A1C6SBW6_9ACTN|nr:acyl-CoA dehydrogenase family protein [Micromonospora pallida]SCL26988.1 Acyl-CoA dehydrogenase [Micromonospora pallida]
MPDQVPVEGHPGPVFPPVPADRALAELVDDLAGRAAEYDRTATFPAESIAAVHRAGVLTATVGSRYGGPGAGLVETVRLLRALGRGDPSVALIASMTLATHAGQARRGTWPAALYRRVLADSLAGPALVNALQVEPELGTPSRGGVPATTATPVAGGGWLLNGRKTFSTGAPGLRWMLVLARTPDEPPRVGTFAVRADAPGITIEPTWAHLGMRASASHDVVLRDAPVATDAVVELSAGGTTVASQDPATRVWGNAAIPAVYLGVAEAARDWLVRFLHERTPANLGRPLASLPRFESALGEIQVRLIEAAELLRGLAERVDASGGEASATAPEPTAPHPASADLGATGRATKLLVNRAVIWAVEYAVSLVGNPGLSQHNPLQRHLRDVLCSRVHFPQEDTVVTELGRAALARFPAPTPIGRSA